MNLFESFDDIINDDFIAKLKSHTNDNLGDVEVAVKGVFYTLVAGLIRRTNSDMSSGMLYNQIQEKYKTNSVPTDITTIFQDKGLLEKISHDGSKIISQIFPAYKSPLLSMIGSYAGTSKNVTVVTAVLTSAILVDLLGKKIESENLDKESLVYYLKQHHELLLQKAPESLMEKMIPALGLQELINTKIVTPKKPEPSQKQSEEIVESNLQTDSFSEKNYEDESSETFFNKKIILILSGVVLLGALLYFLFTQNGSLSFFTKEEAPVEAMDEELQFADSLANSSANPIKSAGVDSLSKIVPQNLSDFSNFKQYVEDRSKAKGQQFDFKSIQYIDKSFDLASTSFSTLDSIANLMNINKNLQIKIIAFSEAGDVSLNNKRAFAVKKGLLNKGINTIRIDAGAGGKGGNSPSIKVVSK